MVINGVKVKAIRPMTSIELLNNYGSDIFDESVDIFCIELENGCTIYPGTECKKNMELGMCQFNLLKTCRGC